MTDSDNAAERPTGDGYQVVDFSQIPAVPCPCGRSRRALADVAGFPGTIHLTHIESDARLHFHKQLTETYYVLQCDAGAQIQLNEDLMDVRPGMCIVIFPFTRHRAIGNMTVLNIVLPKFDPADEWLV